jgi:hypothetical protein
MKDKENLKELMGIEECQNQQSDGGTIEPFFALSHVQFANLLCTFIQFGLKNLSPTLQMQFREGWTSAVSEKEGNESRSN